MARSNQIATRASQRPAMSARSWLARRVPLGRPGKPEEVARFVASLLVEDVPFLTGETIYIDGAQGVNH
jgi:NAD(P)-dependent dehydrogenase (short-subunit alcohol dehydrogenase family)